MAQPPLPATSSTWGPASRLLSFFADGFRPAATVQLTIRHVRNYDQAIAEFERFAGDAVPLAAVNDELLAGFVTAGDAAGRPAKHRRDQAGLIRQVVLAWDGDAVRKPRHHVDRLPPAEPGTVRHYFESVYAAEAMVDVRDTSIVDTRRTMRRLREFAGHDIELAEQTDRLAADFFRWLRDRGLTAAAVNRYRRTWFSVWRHAEERGLVEKVPRVKRLKEVHNPPDAWSLDELRRLLAAALEFRRTDWYAGVRCSLWWHAIVLVDYYSGLRRGSLFAICRADVDLATGQLYVPGENMKNRQGQMFQLGRDAIAAIERIWLPERVQLFETQHHPGTLSKHFGQLLAAAGIPPGRRKGLSKFHKLRRTVATEIAARAGCAAASSLLGHSSSYVTARYIDPTKLPGHDVTRLLPMLAVG